MRSFYIALATTAVMLLAACTTTGPRTEEMPAADAPRIHGEMVEYDGWTALCGADCSCERHAAPEMEYWCSGRHPSQPLSGIVLEFHRPSTGRTNLRYVARTRLEGSIDVTSCPPGRSGDPTVAPEGIRLTSGSDSVGRWGDILYVVSSARMMGCSGGDDGIAIDITAEFAIPSRDTAVIVNLGGMDDIGFRSELESEVNNDFWSMVERLQYTGTVAQLQ